MATKPMTAQEIQQLIQQKLEAFDLLQPEYEASFQFVQDIHGQKRFSSLAVADAVRYLHARWVCECKGRLLSVAKTYKEYEGKLCLELLRLWQEGNTARVVEFLNHRLDMLPLAEITYQIQETQQQQQEGGLVKRLVHGRKIMLNRGMNLIYLLDAIFAFPEAQLQEEVKAACTAFGHLPAQVEQQLKEMEELPLYSYVPHRSLAQRNMKLMNTMGIEVADKVADLPGQRSWRVISPTEPMSPYAEHIIEGYQELVTPSHNNIKDDRFVDHPERNGTEEV